MDQSPYIAAFFAFQRPHDCEKVAIFIFQEYLGEGKCYRRDRPHIIGLGPKVKADPRHFRQQCQYTICTYLLDKAVIKNISSKTIDLKGYVLISIKGNQHFIFPSTILKPGETVTVTSGKNARHDPQRYLLWTKKYIWNNDRNPAELWSPDGELVASWP